MGKGEREGRGERWGREVGAVGGEMRDEIERNEYPIDREESTTNSVLCPIYPPC